MDVSKLFKAYPPREELTSLDAIIRDWRWRTEPGGPLAAKRDDVVTFAASRKTFAEATVIACASKRPDGRMHNHQTKVPKVIKEAFAEAILAEFLNGYGHLDTTSYWHLKDFDRLHDRLETIRPRGIGPVTTYDVAVRIGAWAKVEPESLYLHAGVRAGWLALDGVPGADRDGMGVHRPRFIRGSKRITRWSWPEVFLPFKADDFEDFLCTYRRVFPTLRSEVC